jgi:hypothetical protein
VALGAWGLARHATARLLILISESSKENIAFAIVTYDSASRFVPNDFMSLPVTYTSKMITILFS